MDCFGDITKHNNNFDQTLNTIISRFNKTEDSKILITESVNLVANYETKDGLVPFESWSFPQLNRLAFPVITGKDISDGIQYLFAIQEPNSLTKWSFGGNKQRLEKHFFNSKIIGLIGFNEEISGQPSIEPIVVYENGFCQLISNAIKLRTEENKQKIISEDESIQFIDGLTDENSRHNVIIYLITKSNISTNNTIQSIYKLMVNIETDSIVTIERQIVINQLNNWSLCHKSASILGVSRLNTEFIVFSLNGKTETELFKLNSSSIETIYGLGTTSSGSVCLIGKTKDSNFSIELWESRYGSLLGRMALPYEPLTNDCKVIDNTILITCFKGIVSIPIRIQRISLSQIVGKNKSKELVSDSEFSQELNQIIADFESNDDKSLDEINERFTDIVRQISGNIPEEIILKLLILCSEKLTQNNQNLMNFFEKLVSLPFNELFMISRLKSSKVKFEKIITILRLLTEMLPSNNCAIIDWISIIIDSHLRHFIVNPNEETIEVVIQIVKKIDKFSEFCEQLGQIKTFFEIILSKNKKKDVSEYGSGLVKPNRGQYCIEYLKI